MVFALSISAFAADDLEILYSAPFDTFGSLSPSAYGVTQVSFSASITADIHAGTHQMKNFNVSSNSPTSTPYTASEDKETLSYTIGTVNMGEGTVVLELPVVPDGLKVSSSAASPTISVSLSGSTLTVVSDGSTNPIPLKFTQTSGAPLVKGKSYSLSGQNSVPTPPEPPFDYSGTGSMFGWTGANMLYLTIDNSERWYLHGSGESTVGQLFATWSDIQGEASGIRGDIMDTRMLSILTQDKWKWSVDSNGQLKFTMNSNTEGSWADMLYRTSVYNWYWGQKLWSNDVAGSWYGSISNNFSYLNYRVNQILEVLANDEDLAIKDATTPERDWVKNYFNGSGDKADTGKYDKLNDTGSAFKDAFAGSPDKSIGDGFTTVNDNGYDFWSQAVSDDVNGVNSSSGRSLAPAYVPPEQRIVDAYSQNWAQLTGGYYD